MDGIDREESRELLVKAIKGNTLEEKADEDTVAGESGSAVTRDMSRAVEMTAMASSLDAPTSDLQKNFGTTLGPPRSKNAGRLNLGSAPGTPRVNSGDAQLQKRVNGVESKLDEMMRVLQAALPKPDPKSKTKV